MLEALLQTCWRVATKLLEGLLQTRWRVTTNSVEALLQTCLKRYYKHLLQTCWSITTNSVEALLQRCWRYTTKHVEALLQTCLKQCLVCTSDTTKSGEGTLQTHPTSCTEGYRQNFDVNSFSDYVLNSYDLVYRISYMVDYNIQYARLQITKHYNLYWRLQIEFRPELFWILCNRWTWPRAPIFT